MFSGNAKRPGEELFDIVADPDCSKNLAADPGRANVLTELRSRLDAILTEQGDPRMVGYGDVFEGYPYFGRMQPELGGFKEKGQYNPDYVPPSP